MIRRKRAQTPQGQDPVARVQEQVRTAKGLSAVPGRELLDDSRTNPEVYGHAERLRDAAHRRELDMAHARTLRALRVQDARADRAERQLEAVAAARAADAPERAVLDLSRWRPRVVGAGLAASAVLSVGSAMGIEALAATWGAPTGVGYVAELGLTGLSTAAIMLRGWQVRYGADLTTWQARCMTAAIVVPLLGSIVGSTAGSGPVGAACSIGAAAFAGLAYLASVTLSTAIRYQITRLDRGTAEERLAATATQQDTPAPAAAAAAGAHSGGQEPEESPVAVEAAEFLQQHTPPPLAGGARAGGQGAHLDEVGMPIPDGYLPAGAPGSARDGAQGAREGGQEEPEDPPEDAHEDADEDGSAGVVTQHPTPAAVQAYRRAHPDQTLSEIAEAFGVSRRTIGRHLRQDPHQDPNDVSGGGA